MYDVVRQRETRQMKLVPSLRRASNSLIPQLFRCRRQSQRPLADRCLRFSTVPHDEDLFHHIQSNGQIFPQPTPRVLYVPDGFPFHVEKTGPKPDDIRFRRAYRLEEIYIKVDKFSLGRIPSLQMSGLIFNEYQNMKFRVQAEPDDARMNIISISDVRSRHVAGSEKYLETKGINPSTIKILFDYLRNRVIPRHDEFPFEIKDGFSSGTLTLRRKCEDEILIVKVKAVDENRILDELAEFEAPCPVNNLKDQLDKSDKYDFEEKMKIFENSEVRSDGDFGDIGCLLMSVSNYYGYRYSKRIKLEIFALPDQIVVPEISLCDNGGNGLEAFDAYFKDRGIHTGTTNIMIESLTRLMAEQKSCVKAEPVPKIFGRFDDSEMKAPKCRAEERFIKGCTMSFANE